MKWLRHNDDNSSFEDRRGRRTSGGKLTIGGIAGGIIVVASLLLGKAPSQMLQMADSVLGSIDNNGSNPQTEIVDPTRINEHEEWKIFTLRVFNSCNDVWEQIFTQELGQKYEKPTLVAFTESNGLWLWRSIELYGIFLLPNRS